MRIPFTKMHGLGNDFVVFDATARPLALTAAHVRHIADRHYGIGCDQVLLVEASDRAEIDFRYRIFNADGAEVEQCGNGARCFARFVHDRGLSAKHEIAVATNAGVIYPRLEANGEVSVNMGVPRFNPADVPFTADAEALVYTVEVNGAPVELSAVSMGNPHAALIVPDVASAPVATLGPVLERHTRFPRRVNVGFVEVASRTHLRVRVFERGAGETRACGTGACAAMVSAHRRGFIEGAARVSLPGGDLHITWQGPGTPVWMRGPAAAVFDGVIDLEGV